MEGQCLNALFARSEPTSDHIDDRNAVFGLLMRTAQCLIEQKNNPWEIPAWCYEDETEYKPDAQLQEAMLTKSDKRPLCHNIDRF